MAPNPNTLKKAATLDEALSTPVAKTEQTAVAIAEPASPLMLIEDEATRDMFLADAMEGNAFALDEVAIPFLRVVQGLSPEKVRTNPKYINGIAEGDIFDSVTREFWKSDEGLLIIPVYQVTNVTEWKPRDPATGVGGFVADHGTKLELLADCTIDEKKNRIRPNGNELVRGAMYYVFIVNPETNEYTPAVLNLVKSQLKYAFRWNAEMQKVRVRNPKTGSLFEPKMYWNVWRLRTFQDASGTYSFYSFSFERAGDTANLKFGWNTYGAAMEFAKKAAAGGVKVAPHEEAEVLSVEDVAQNASPVNSVATGPVRSEAFDSDFTVDGEGGEFPIEQY